MSQGSNALSCAVSNHISLTATRQETLDWLVVLMMRHGTICLWRLAAYVATCAQTNSVRRRFYRFFQYVTLDCVLIARSVVAFLGLHGKPWVLAIDRTNWEFGKTTINILMLSVVWNGVGVPLLWTMLPSAGNSDTATRTALLDQLRETFPDLKIAALTGDREFIGDDWMAHLAHQKIPFVLRLRENQQVVREGYATLSLVTLAKNLKRGGERLIVKGVCRLGQSPTNASPAVRLVILRLKSGELLALACSGKPHRALETYRQRWTIETLFGNLKTRGFNLEDTHLTNTEKLSTLLGILALSVAMTVKAGAIAAKTHPIPLKKHGYKARSLFALGLDTCRKLCAFLPLNVSISQLLNAILQPKTHTISRKSMALERGV